MALMIAGGLTASLFIAMGIWWGVSKIGPRGVPVVQPDERPWRVRPDDRGGLQVPNQGSEVFERGAAAARPAADARL
ncbi:MAG: hypothetical protein K2X11_00980, partial [Acetobacteraceae bacterium]|nr:hypothetical protein [Acetobacteraceae bacterium]